MWNGGTIGGVIPYDLLFTNSALVTFYTVTGLTRGNSYKFTVAAINLVGTGPATEILTLVAS
jgi:hypothetical protein